MSRNRLCVHMAITLHNNLTEAKIANESIRQFSILLLTIYSTKSCFISWPARLIIPRVLQSFHVRFLVLVNHANGNTFVMDVENQ